MNLPIINHDDYVAKINDDNKFPIKKFGELAKYLIIEGVTKKFIQPEFCSVETLSKAHSVDYINKIKNKNLDIQSQKKIGFPLNDSVVNRSFRATGGTVLASKLALQNRLSCNTAGGSHHATRNEGAGYCVFNDVAVAAKHALSKKTIKKVLIIDLDVHQGNGNSEIFKNDRSVFTFSMHCKSNYPAKKSNSDLDVELKDNTEDKKYIDVLKKNLLILNKENFDLIFYIAGVDIHYNDRLGKLKITDEGIKNREELVISNFFEKKIPLCGVLGGGYNKDFKKLVELHAILHKSCSSIL